MKRLDGPTVRLAVGVAVLCWHGIGAVPPLAGQAALLREFRPAAEVVAEISADSSDRSPAAATFDADLTGGERREGASQACRAQGSGSAPGGWTALFDGASLDGWRGIGLDSVPAGHWIVEDGAIRKLASGAVPIAADGQPLEGGDLMTVGTYRDFELTFQWKVSAGANSGVKYNVSEPLSLSVPPVHAALGFEYQVLDDALHPDARNGPTRTAGALYDLVAAPPDKPLHAVGSWNEARIIFSRGHGEHWLNGERIVAYDLGSAAFDSALAASKYAPIDGFADRRSGHIVLQDHGDDVWFRTICIREIGP